MNEIKKEKSKRGIHGLNFNIVFSPYSRGSTQDILGAFSFTDLQFA